MDDARHSEGCVAELGSQEGEGKSKSMECCPLSNHVSHLEREK